MQLAEITVHEIQERCIFLARQGTREQVCPGAEADLAEGGVRDVGVVHRHQLLAFAYAARLHCLCPLGILQLLLLFDVLFLIILSCNMGRKCLLLWCILFRIKPTRHNIVDTRSSTKLCARTLAFSGLQGKLVGDP